MAYMFLNALIFDFFFQVFQYLNLLFFRIKNKSYTLFYFVSENFLVKVLVHFKQVRTVFILSVWFVVI